MSLTALLLPGACVPVLQVFQCPAAVRADAVFTLEVTATGSPSGGSGHPGGNASGMILQLPNGFTVLGEQVLYEAAVTLTRDDPLVLQGYQAEPGHFLTSFVGVAGNAVLGAPMTLRVFVRAPTALGSHQVKFALAGGTGPVGGSATALTAVAPAGVTQFAAITTAPHVRGLVVQAAPATPFETEGAALAAMQIGALLGEPQFADVDGDGDLDCFVRGPQVGATRQQSVLLAAPGVAWQTRTTGLPTDFLGSAATSAVGDFDGDGFTDLALADGRVFFGDATGWQAGPAFSGAPLISIAAADIDNDGRDDLVAATSTGGLLHLAGQTNRTFLLQATGLPAAGLTPPSFLLLEDLTGDGAPDLYAATTSLPNVFSWSGGTFTAGSGVPADGRLAAAGDLDGDQQPELVLFGLPDGAGGTGVQVLTRTGIATWSPAATTGLPATGLRSAGALIDHDGDGDLDVLSGRLLSLPSAPAENGGVELWQNDGTGAFVLVATSGLPTLGSVRHIAVGDFDGDGFDDVAVAASSVQVPGGMATFHRSMAQGAVQRVRTGCGTQALVARGSGTLGSNLAITATDTVGLGLIGMGLSFPLLPLCPSCLAGHDWLVAIGGTSAVLVIPNNPALSGFAVGMQAADQFAPSACDIPVTLTDTLILTIP